MTAAWIMLGAVLLLALIVLRSFNRLVRLRNESLQAWSGVELQLQRRADLVPQLAEIVRGYAVHERETFAAVTQARSATKTATELSSTAQADGAMQGAARQLLAVAEAYPQLKASENFSRLQQQLQESEDRLAGARRYYNAVVRRYNTLIGSVPDTFVARAFRFAEREFYRLEDDSDAEPVAVGLAQPSELGGTSASSGNEASTSSGMEPSPNGAAK